MILIFKTNDLLRGIESSLGTKRNMASFIQVVKSRPGSFSSWNWLILDVTKLHWGVEGEKSDRGRDQCCKVSIFYLNNILYVYVIPYYTNLGGRLGSGADGANSRYLVTRWIILNDVKRTTGWLIMPQVFLFVYWSRLGSMLMLRGGGYQAPKKAFLGEQEN